ncbi:MAG: topoisomerase DNA-binding C4 zinc finger domain-containing protein [Methylothermaceae bacterium]|nr:topoisomerase DNA-binding C4 zinc finger domain-containing protein [Methylothermaceae bacterium]
MAFARGKSLKLIDGDQLVKQIGEVQTVPAGVGRSAVANSESEPPAAITPECPRCGSEMVLRTARRGEGKGTRFWGCASFPRCRGTRAV